MAKHMTWCLKRAFVLTVQQIRFHTHLQTRLVAKASNSVVPKGHLAASAVNKPGFDFEEEPDHRELEMFVEDARKGRKHAISALMKLLCITEANASKAVEAYPALRNMEKQTIYNNFHILRENGMFKSTIKDKKFLLIGSSEDVKVKISLVESFGVNINKAAAFFQLSITVLRTCSLYAKIDASYLPAHNKLYYLADRLKVDIEKICYVVSYNPWILKIPTRKLMTVTEFVLDAGMASEHLLSDLRLYLHALSTIKRKIEQAKAIGIHPLKPWVVRANDKRWISAGKRLAEDVPTIKPTIPREQFICEIFECDVDLARCILTKGYNITTMAFDKFLNNMKLLKDQGYSAEEIMMSTLIVQRSTRTLTKHFDMWNEAGLPKGRLCLFYRSSEQMQQLITERLAELEDGHQS